MFAWLTFGCLTSHLIRMNTIILCTINSFEVKRRIVGILGVRYSMRNI